MGLLVTRALKVHELSMGYPIFACFAERGEGNSELRQKADEALKQQDVLMKVRATKSMPGQLRPHFGLLLR